MSLDVNGIGNTVAGVLFHEFNGAAFQLADHHLTGTRSIHARPIWTIRTTDQFLVRIPIELKYFLLVGEHFPTWN